MKILIDHTPTIPPRSRRPPTVPSGRLLAFSMLRSNGIGPRSVGDAIYDLLSAGVAACRHRKRMIWWWNTTSWPFHLSAVTNQTND